ncbi:hypothetical protein [Zhongshania sp.]|uniref:hypothetical protein n=1 Tax=Zhongshania sp. TaxID=1971902 RepID=UPI003564A303
MANGDTTDYPETLAYHVEPTPEHVANWHDFVDPAITADTFTISVSALNRNLAIDNTDKVQTAVPGSAPANETFIFEEAANCETLPKAQSHFSGQPFKDT